jgi:hypothetical protein
LKGRKIKKMQVTDESEGYGVVEDLCLQSCIPIVGEKTTAKDQIRWRCK